MNDCPFCKLTEVCYEGRLVVALWDRYPVNPGHCLLIPKRHVGTWWDATSEERSELMEATFIAKGLIEEKHRPGGFNVGFNAGDVAGQTVHHLHVHVIPRYAGDVPDSRGGVRWVIPDRANYLARREV